MRDFFKSPVRLMHGAGRCAQRLWKASRGFLFIAAFSIAGGQLAGLAAEAVFSDGGKRAELQQSMYERSDAMRDADQQVVTQIATTLLQDEKWQKIAADWDNLSGDEQTAAMKDIHQMFIAQFAEHGIDTNDVTTVSEAPFLCPGLICSVGGSFHKSTRVITSFSFDPSVPVTKEHYDDSSITWNVHPWHKALFGGSFIEAVNVLVHESTHSVQHQLAANLDYLGQAGKDARFDGDARIYDAASDSYDEDYKSFVTYQYNPLEVQAFSNGDCVQLALETAQDVAANNPDLLDPVRAIVSVCMDEHKPGDLDHTDQTPDELRQADTKKGHPAAGSPSV